MSWLCRDGQKLEIVVIEWSKCDILLYNSEDGFVQPRMISGLRLARVPQCRYHLGQSRSFVLCLGSNIRPRSNAHALVPTYRIPTLRAFRNLANADPIVENKTIQPKREPQVAPVVVQDKKPTEVVSQADQRKKDWKIVKKLLSNVWPKDDWWTRGRVIVGFSLLICGKVSRIAGPYSYVDADQYL